MLVANAFGTLAVPGWGAYGEADTSLVSAVASSQVRTLADFSTFASRVEASAQAEYGSTLSSGARSNLQTLVARARLAGDANPVNMAPYFAKVKEWVAFATGGKATKTAGAITDAARWFYYNVEQAGVAPIATPPVSGNGVPQAPRRGFSPNVEKGLKIGGIALGTVLVLYAASRFLAPRKRSRRRT